MGACYEHLSYVDRLAIDEYASDSGRIVCVM